MSTFNYNDLSTADKFEYLAVKLTQHMNTNNVLKVVNYWTLVIRLPYKEAPKELLPVFSDAKKFIKKELLL